MIKPEDIIPIKSFTDLMDATKARLRDLKFRITNLRPGGVFYTLLEMAHQGLADLYALLKTIAPQLYLETATGDWLDLRAADYETYRKLAQKTKGNVTFGRYAAGSNVVIPAGSIVATAVDRYGERLQYLANSQVVLESANLEVAVPVEAEFAGANYNVGSMMITELVTYIAGVDYVKNLDGWITTEGTDTETDDSLRERAQGKWSQLSVGGGRDAYIAWAKEITGVAAAQVDDAQPRGQGTVDVIITGTAGVPTQDLVTQVQTHINAHKPLCTDVLVAAPVAVPVAFDVTIHVDRNHGDLNAIKARGEEIIDVMFRYGTTDLVITKIDPAYGVIRAQVSHNLMTIEYVVNVTLTAPAADVPVTMRQLATKGAVTVVAQRAV